MNAITTGSLALALSIASFAALAETHGAPCNTAATSLQTTLVAKSEQGVDALRDYLFITRGIYNLRMEDAVAMIERQHAAQRNCTAAVALAEPR